jgi:hypothetical protein
LEEGELGGECERGDDGGVLKGDEDSDGSEEDLGVVGTTGELGGTGGMERFAVCARVRVRVAIFWEIPKSE